MTIIQIKRKVHKMASALGYPICLCNYNKISGVCMGTRDNKKVTCSDCLKLIKGE